MISCHRMQLLSGSHILTTFGSCCFLNHCKLGPLSVFIFFGTGSLKTFDRLLTIQENPYSCVIAPALPQPVAEPRLPAPQPKAKGKGRLPPKGLSIKTCIASVGIHQGLIYHLNVSSGLSVFKKAQGLSGSLFANMWGG